MHGIVVIGAGFTGIMLAAHLLRSTAPRALKISLVERLSRPAGGVAYGTTCRDHLLNVPAGRMSAFPDQPDHFLAWAQRLFPNTRGVSFMPRAVYGRYLLDVLEESLAQAPNGNHLQRVAGDVVGIDASAPDGSLTVQTGNSVSLRADHAVLAVGNFAPRNPWVADPTFYSDPRYVRDPWARGLMNGTDPDAPVLLIGTGLTMLDIAIQISSEGHRGTIHAISRHGLVPQPHRHAGRDPRPYPRPADLDQWPPTARGAFQALRAEVEKAARQGVNWREVVTSLRHDTPAIWKSWDKRSREQFLRHLRPYWETHRHRAAPAAAETIRKMTEQGRLVVHSGRIMGYEASAAHVEVIWRKRGEATTDRISAARVINCTGPESDPRVMTDDLMRSLLASGAITPDPLGLGVQSTDEGAVIDKHGRASPSVSVVGPLRKGGLWENTAVPELRGEVAALAKRLIREVAPRTGGRGTSGLAI